MSTYLLQPLQIALIALLPKTGEGLTVAELAKAACITPAQVTEALLMPYMEFYVDFDVTTDTYTLCRDPSARSLPATHDSPSERTQA